MRLAMRYLASIKVGLAQIGFVPLMVGLAGCYGMRGSNGGGQINNAGARERQVNSADIALQSGYSIKPIATGLTFPTAITFGANNTPYVIEAGYSYGEVWNDPKLLKLEADGTWNPIATGSKNGPWTGVVWHDGYFYIAEGGTMEGGKILKVAMDGTINALIKGLPTRGNHHTNGPVIADGFIYFGLGVATNSGVVGPDNRDFGWLPRAKDFHDIPCADITLAGVNYESLNVLSTAPDDKTSTGAYVPFGTPLQPAKSFTGPFLARGRSSVFHSLAGMHSSFVGDCETRMAWP